MRTLIAVAALVASTLALAADPEHAKSVEAWRARVDKNLRADNGWLTLAGRFQMKPGDNTFGTGEKNDIVFPKGLGPERIGVIHVAPGTVTVKLAPGVTMTKDGAPFTERVMGTNTDKRDWVTMGRAAMHVIEREGRYILRLADNESPVRSGFQGRVWYDVNDAYWVDAKFVPYPPGKKVAIVNVLDELSDEPSPGYVEFKLGGKVQRLDVVGDDEGLFMIFRDETAGKTTYKPGRFLYVEKKPEPNKPFKLDLNRAYNPPCAFSEYTTCPLPPEQNILKVKVEAGKKYPPKRAS
jgi:uncharacterized protein (DUF1684 family)